MHASHGWLAYLLTIVTALACMAMPAMAQEQKPDEKPLTLPEVVVPGLPEQPYNPQSATTATKSDTPIALTPATVNVVPRELLDDRQPRSFVEALRTVPGISATSPRISTQNTLSRGFSLRQSGGEFRNGLRHFENTNQAPELANVEQFEILKGPASVLYGRGGLGGLLNVITKTPQTSRRFLLEQSVGNWDYYRTAIDLTGPIDKQGVWSYRFNGSYENAGHFQDFAHQETILVSPVLAWRPSANTSLVVDFEFLRADYDGNIHALPADGTVLPNPNGRIPISFSIMDPNFNRSTREQSYAGYQFDHRFSDSLAVHQGFLAAYSVQPNFIESGMTGFVGDFTGPRRFVQRRTFDFSGNWHSFALDTNALGKFATGPVRHELLGGFDLYRAVQSAKRFDAPLPNLDLLNPVYGVQPTGPFTQTFDLTDSQQWAGFYVQEILIPWDPLRIVLAGRVTSIRTERENRLNQDLSRTASDTPLTPRLGVVYTPVQAVSLFASYSTSFQPILGGTFSGEAFVPEEGVAYEGGVKTVFWDGRLSATLAVFRMTRENVLTADPANRGFSVQTGEQRSQGVEWELGGQPLPGWQVIAAFTWLDAEVTKDNTFLVGQRIPGVPEFSFSLWNTYTLPSGPLQGFGGGFGIFYEDVRSGQLVSAATVAQAFDLPSYVRGDMALFYRQKHYEVNLNFNNVTDERYFVGTFGRTQVFPGEPFNVTATVRLIF